MMLSLFRGAATAGLAAAAVAGTLAVAPAASAATSSAGGSSMQCRTQISSSATSGTGATSTRCAKAPRGRQAAVSGRDGGASTGFKPGSSTAKSARSAAELRGWVSTGLHFRNSTSSTVSVTIMYYDPAGCSGYGDWGTQGWWNIAPGQEVNVKNTSNRYATFYAHSDRLAWSGPYNVYVKSSAFQSCVNIGSTDSRIVGERLVDLGDVSAFPYTTYTVNLTE
jgi:uncharacterized membrane protein